MSALTSSNVVIRGQGQRPMVFAHGFGCDQNMWRFVAPAFEASHRVVLFDHVGCGQSDLAAFDEQRHARIEGWAQDVVDILEAADLHDAVFVGHSVSATIGVLAANVAPGRIGALAMLCPSPRYLNDPPAYVGGFERSDIDALLDMVENNMLGWANFLAPLAMGADNDPELIDELKASFCAIDPYITRRFAAATFLGDNRADLARLGVPALVVEMTHDAIAPPSVGRWLRATLPQAQFATLDGAGHCPHMTHPADTTAPLRRRHRPALRPAPSGALNAALRRARSPTACLAPGCAWPATAASSKPLVAPNNWWARNRAAWPAGASTSCSPCPRTWSTRRTCCRCCGWPATRPN